MTAGVGCPPTTVPTTADPSAGSVAFQLAIHSLPLTRELFDITALTRATPRCLALGVAPVTSVELAKLVRARRDRIRPGRG